MSALKNLSVADVAAYKQQFLSTLHITIYAYGNITRQVSLLKTCVYAWKDLKLSPSVHLANNSSDV